MAKVYLTSCCVGKDPDAYTLNEYRRIVECRRRDRFGVHTAAESPNEADLIVFAELADHAGPIANLVKETHAYKSAPDRCVLYNPRYVKAPTLPGLYASIRSKWSAPGFAVSSHYLQIALESDDINITAYPEEPHLFSFCGASDTWGGRARVLALPPENALLLNTAEEKRKVEATGAAPGKDYRERYVRSLQDSLFVVCPRGDVPSSLRVFEVLKAGRVPVIVSDEWVRPTGPDWDSFSVTIPEADIESIPTILAELEPQAREMGRRAGDAHAEWFSADASYHRIVGWGLEILENKSTKEARIARRRSTVEHAVRRLARHARRTLRGQRSTRR